MTKKSILLKAPPASKAVVAAAAIGEPLPVAAERGGRSATTHKLQPGIIRMVSPKTAAPTKVDVGTSITPVKSHVLPAAPAPVSAAVSRRLLLPEEEEPAGEEEEEADDMSLECQEVFDDSFDKNSDNEPAESRDKPRGKESGNNAGSDRSVMPVVTQPDAEAVDLLKPLPEPVVPVPEGRTGLPLEVRTNEFGLVEVVTPAADKSASLGNMQVPVLMT
jgi:hypothetical protein